MVDTGIWPWHLAGVDATLGNVHVGCGCVEDCACALLLGNSGLQLEGDSSGQVAPLLTPAGRAAEGPWPFVSRCPLPGRDSVTVQA